MNAGFRLWALGLVTVLLLIMTGGGCILTLIPIIPPGGGEDIGPILSFTRFAPAQDSYPKVTETYARQADGTYRMTSDLANYDRVDLIRFGQRGNDPIYLVQTNANSERSALGHVDPPPISDEAALVRDGYLYFITIVAARPDGIAAQAAILCNDKSVQGLATRLGLTLDCEKPSPGSYVFRIADHPSKEVMLAFLKEVLSRHLFVWTDEANLSPKDLLQIE